ncbi:MAG: hypothetical protein K0S81_1673 [Rhodospirillales bacterium]|nr:hypothetical protein [Rhodospirillales bacterium]
MTLATLLKAALVAYGLLLGGAFVFIRFYPDLAGRTVFEWRRGAASIAGSLSPVSGVDRAWLGGVPVELLDPGFGDRLAQIAGDARREIEALARAAAEEARQQAVAAAEAELSEAERRLGQAEQALAGASVQPPSEPAPVSAGTGLEPALFDPAQDRAVLAAAGRLESARVARASAGEALDARARSFLAELQRDQAVRQLRASSRRLAEMDGGGIEIALDNAGPLAVTQLVLALSSQGQPVATLGGRAVLASKSTGVSFVPEIVNEYNEKILGLPPKFQWRMILPLDPALEGRPGGLSVDVLEAEFADPAALERSTPYGSGMRVWSYPQAAAAGLFEEGLRSAAPRFPETQRLADAERAVAVAEVELVQARAAAEERARLAHYVAAGPSTAQLAADEAGRQAKAEQAAARLRAAEDERDRRRAERDEILFRLDRIRSGTEPVLLSDRISDEGWQASLEQVKRSIATRILEARAQELRGATRTDPSGAFRFTGAPFGTYYLYSLLAEPSGRALHYLQRIESGEEGETVFEPPVVMSPEQFLQGAMEAGS